MIHFTKSPSGKFQNIITASNGKVLFTSELFNTKRAAMGNIRALVTVLGVSVVFQDDTEEDVETRRMTLEGDVILTASKPKPRYQAGRNKK